jgi:hypothetical protein
LNRAVGWGVGGAVVSGRIVIGVVAHDQVIAQEETVRTVGVGRVAIDAIELASASGGVKAVASVIGGIVRGDETLVRELDAIECVPRRGAIFDRAIPAGRDADLGI